MFAIVQTGHPSVPEQLAETGRRKHIQVAFLWITLRFRAALCISDQRGTLGRKRINVHVTGDRTKE